MTPLDAAVATGVYVILRDDLRLAYVGQSLNVTRRVRAHLRGRTYAYVREQLLDPRGDAPRTVVLPCDPEHLNECEHHFFGAVTAAGYRVINQSRQRGVWGGAVKSQRSGGISSGAAALHERRRHDPDVEARFHAGAVLGGHVAVPLLNARKRRCLDCGRVSNPGGIGRHQNLQDHHGWEEVT